MKTFSDKTREQAVRRMLTTAYTQKDLDLPDPGILWQQAVMRDVRRIGPLNLQGTPLLLLERFVWRFDMAACGIALFLLIYAGMTGWNPLDELNAQFFTNPAEFTVAQAFGGYEDYE